MTIVVFFGAHINFNNLGANAHGVEQVSSGKNGQIELSMLQRTILALMPLTF